MIDWLVHFLPDNPESEIQEELNRLIPRLKRVSEAHQKYLTDSMTFRPADEFLLLLRQTNMQLDRKKR